MRKLIALSAAIWFFGISTADAAERVYASPDYEQRDCVFTTPGKCPQTGKDLVDVTALVEEVKGKKIWVCTAFGGNKGKIAVGDKAPAEWKGKAKESDAEAFMKRLNKQLRLAGYVAKGRKQGDLVALAEEMVFLSRLIFTAEPEENVDQMPKFYVMAYHTVLLAEQLVEDTKAKDMEQAKETMTKMKALEKEAHKIFRD